MKTKSLPEAMEALARLANEREVLNHIKREYEEAKERYDKATSTFNKSVDALKKSLAEHFPELVHECEDC